MLYFEDARLEFYGVPMAYMPFFSTPDPTVQRKSGFLVPTFTSYTPFGVGVEVPYYFALAPDYDLTLSPRFATRQGVLMQGEFRQRLMDGAYQIRAYGINQLDPDAFGSGPGNRDFRGGVDTQGQFALNDKWVWGWDGVLLSDYFFFSDYRLRQYRDPMQSFLTLPTEAISQLYLTGVGNRSYFDARAIYYLSFSGNQSMVPVVAPVIDYSNVINHSVIGGEFSYKFNFVNLARDQPQFDPISTLANTSFVCAPTSAELSSEKSDQLFASRCSGNIYALDRTSTVAEVVHLILSAKSGRRLLRFVPTQSTPTSRTARHSKVHTARYHAGNPAHARCGPRISLSLHQRSALGHHNDRTDRAGHHPSE